MQDVILQIKLEDNTIFGEQKPTVHFHYNPKTDQISEVMVGTETVPLEYLPDTNLDWLFKETRKAREIYLASERQRHWEPTSQALSFIVGAIVIGTLWFINS